ncbi:hypothetical protein KUCAC02_013820 [Chaenocephalus aceratus]|uniref:Uncharacterized protein n=1 Tax=Chaenocephalus aceratus TaxID=36190 RepID=A0ACB9WC67_CHAAC|nr:hypothetical protein KUCAC02_013820 [Chaenocephalus aceratus]
MAQPVWKWKTRRCSAWERRKERIKEEGHPVSLLPLLVTWERLEHASPASGPWTLSAHWSDCNTPWLHRGFAMPRVISGLLGCRLISDGRTGRQLCWLFVTEIPGVTLN